MRRDTGVWGAAGVAAHAVGKIGTSEAPYNIPGTRATCLTHNQGYLYLVFQCTVRTAAVHGVFAPRQIRRNYTSSALPHSHTSTLYLYNAIT